MTDAYERRKNRFDETLTRGEKQSFEIDCSEVGYVDLTDGATVEAILKTPTTHNTYQPDDDPLTVDTRSVSMTLTADTPGIYELRVFVTTGETKTAFPRDAPLTIWVSP